jgi:O-antigen/teichoic acid export membrane protein
VALYDLGYRVAGVLNMFIIMPFSLSLMPIAYKIYGKPGDKRYYSKLMTYLTYIMIWGGLGLSIYSKEIIILFSQNPDYWPSYVVVPIVVFAYVFSGMRMLVVLGQFLTKNTGSIATTTIMAALLNIILNFIFIPLYGLIAAAYTTLISFIFLFFISDRISDRYYHIPFEYQKLVKIIIVGCILYFLAVFIPIRILLLSIFVKLILLLSFPFILFVLNFYEKVEVQSIIGFIRKWKHFRELKNYIMKDDGL